MSRDQSLLELTVERPVPGGDMLARWHGRVVLVTGAIPGERVRARVVRTQAGVLHAVTVDVVEPHEARVEVAGDPACGGQVYRHVAYDHQLTLKSAVIRDALSRIAKMQDVPVTAVAGSPPVGYRMRARLSVGPEGLGFLRDGTHTVCDARATHQLLEETGAVVTDLAERMGAAGRPAVDHVVLAESLEGDQRVFHVCVRCPVDPDRLRRWRGPGVSGITARRAHGGRLVAVCGLPTITQPISALVPGASVGGALTRHAPSFFQGNRYLLPTLVDAVHRRIQGGPVLDLYAGVGVFAVTLAARGTDGITAVERDRDAAADLRVNARPFRRQLKAVSRPVESYLSRRSEAVGGTVVVDPPRTGLSGALVERLSELAARRIVYVACDVATFARDLRRFTERGYVLGDLEALDMFPNTAHIELVATLER